MPYQFTPAAIRALWAAAGWTSHAEDDRLEASALLLGLLGESECRAAIILARHAIDPASVLRRWPRLTRCMPLRGGVESQPSRFSADVEASLLAASERLAAYPRPLTLATEHLLLGLTAAGHEVSVWLRQQGVEPDALAAEIDKLYGYQPGTLPLELALPLEQDLPLVTSIPPLTPGEGQGVRGSSAEVASSPVLAHPSLHPEGEETGTRPGCSPAGEIGLLRALDAAANRAREGLRTVEDLVRFVWDDRHLTEQCKLLRHELATLVGRIGVSQRLAARETQADVGTALATPSESQRAGMAGLLGANFARLQESLRSLEEFGKLYDASWAAELKQLRYRSYTLQRAVEITRHSLERLAGARLYVLLDGRPTAEEFQRMAGLLVEAGVDVLQLRDKRLDDRRLLERARLLRQLTGGTQTLFVMNDRADLAALSQADGVHVGQDELSVKDARSLVGPEALVGVSTHSLVQARQAVLEGANYIGVGPTYPSGTKHFDSIPGLELLRAVAADIRLPAFAVGGISAANLPEVLAAGFSRVALSGAITTAPDPAAAARQLRALLGKP